MTTTELRIDGCRKNIEKAQRTLDNKIKLLAKKAQKCNKVGIDNPETFDKFNPSRTSDQYWAHCDWSTTLEDIQNLNKKIEGYKERLVFWKQKKQAEEDKANVPMIPSVEAFLSDWRVKAEEYFRADVIKFKDWSREHKKYRENQLKELIEIYGEYEVKLARKKSPELMSEMKKRNVDENYQGRYIRNNFSSMTPRYASLTPAVFDKTLKKELDTEVIQKRIDLYYRCSAVVGVITDATGLTTGDNGCINGFIIGEDGKAKVETIYAGGYNIQCIHFRTLVTAINDKAEPQAQQASSKAGEKSKPEKNSEYKGKSLQELKEMAEQLEIVPKEYSDEKIFRMRLIMAIKSKKGE